MSVKIELLNRYQLRSKENIANVLMLPVIEVQPGDVYNLPHICRIDISVTGTPPELAAVMQSAYKSVNFGHHQPLKLSAPQRLRQGDCRWEKQLPSGVNCFLQITVEYFDSDGVGRPILSVMKKATAECQIWTYPIKNFILEDMVSVSPVSKDEVVDVIVQDKQTDISYPGWFAIDFGTSNSTVTLYDPKVIVTPDCLPDEQEVRLRLRLTQWLNDCPVDDLPGVNRDGWNSEWQKFLLELCKNFKNVNTSTRHNIGDQLFTGVNSTTLLEAIRQVEIGLSKRLPWFRRAASKRLNHIYHEVFRVPALEWQSLIPVELDQDRRLSEINSELEVIDLENSDITVSLGKEAKDHREYAIRNGEEIDGRFLHSPKRYFGQERSFKITVNGKSDTIPVNKLLQSAYAELIELTEEYRQRYPGKCSLGKFYRAVVTYPTIASPFMRREIETLVKSLGIDDVQMAYDEAVSVAIFFLWREFGGDLNVGIESFKTRCRSDGHKWWQNVLVLDIGGGTTDLGLIRLTLEEIDPFEPGEDRGDGGRYYKLTPKLLGSSGHLQLGGELITLRLFFLLKAAVVDCLLTAVVEERLPKDILRIQPEELSDRFLNKGKFQPGKLVACIDQQIPEGEAYKEALNAAEKVLPTRWKNAPARAQTFYTLWEYAENAKLILGQKREQGLPNPIFVLDGQKISELLAQNDTKLPREFIDNISVIITIDQFERVASPVIQEAIGIGQGLIENAFVTTNQEQVDWLILSGKTCNLELVEKELYRVFSKSDYFIWNQERVTFEPEYTKLATSAGACFAEKLRQLSFSPKQAKNLLRKGANQLYVDVKNLFYFLPCSFKREVIGGSSQPIFHAGQELYQLQAEDAMAKFRSPWQGMQLTNNINRQDFENVKPQLWGSYNGDALMKKLGITEDDFKNNIKVQFEINQKLEIDLLLCRGNPHYLISTDIPFIDAGQAISTTTVISTEGKVICDIAVNVAESANSLKTDAHHLVFASNKNYSQQFKTFHYENGTTQPPGIGLIAELPPFPVSGKHSFYFQFHNPESNKWELIGELPQPKVKTEYPCRYYASMNEKGILRVHAFEIPYLSSVNSECLSQNGCVYRDNLQLQPNDIEVKRDPFSGEH